MARIILKGWCGPFFYTQPFTTLFISVDLWQMEKFAYTLMLVTGIVGCQTVSAAR